MKKYWYFILILGMKIFAQVGVNNLDFENWDQMGLVGFTWCGSISQQTVGTQNGNSYLRVKSEGPNSILGYANLCEVNPNTFRCGSPYAQRPAAFKGYVRTSLVGQDTVFIKGDFKKNFSTPVATFSIAIYQNINSWQLISIPINYLSNLVPDTVDLYFIANKKFGHSQPYPSGGWNTLLEVDNFSFDFTAGVAENIEEERKIVAYPNPAHDHITVTFGKALSGNKTLELYNSNGALLEKNEFLENTKTIDIQNYPTGLYFYKVGSYDHGCSSAGRFLLIK
jgi:hypothetical protein